MQQVDKITVVIAHSNPFLSAGLARHLDGFAEFAPVVPGLELEALITGCESRDVVVADYDSGLRLLEPNSGWRDRVVIFTERDGEEDIRRAVKQGVPGYLLLGCGVADVAAAIRSVHQGGTALDPLVAARIAARVTWKKLTPCELDILQLLPFGLTNKEIARATGRAAETVKTHIRAIFRKLDAGGRMQAVMVARHRGILAADASERMLVQANLRDSGHPHPGDGTQRVYCHNMTA